MLTAYLVFTAILVLTPGSTTAVVVRNALSGGRSAGMATAAGAAVGNTSHAAAAALGLAVVFARFPVAMAALRLCGATYLVWLGARSVYRAVRCPDELAARTGRHAMRPARGRNGEESPVSSPARSPRGGFRQGLAVNLLNPAIATFYLVVVPSFIPAAAPRGYFALLALVHVVMALATHVAWTLALDGARHLFAHVGVRRALEGATGVALLALALRVLFSEPLQP